MENKDGRLCTSMPVASEANLRPKPIVNKLCFFEVIRNGIFSIGINLIAMMKSDFHELLQAAGKQYFSTKNIVDIIVLCRFRLGYFWIGVHRIF